MNDRQKKLISLLRISSQTSIIDAARHFDVTEMTIRRDLKTLEKEGHSILVSCGNIILQHKIAAAGPVSSTPKANEKFAIAERLYQLIFPVSTLFLSGGSTTMMLAQVLASHDESSLTVVTNSLNIASILFPTGCKVILLGGELRTEMMDLMGSVAEKNLGEYHVDWLVSGCDAVCAEDGVYTSDLSICNLEKKSLQIADHVAIITDSSKFGKKSLTRFASFDDIELLVTDNAISESERQKLLGHPSLKLETVAPAVL